MNSLSDLNLASNDIPVGHAWSLSASAGRGLERPRFALGKVASANTPGTLSGIPLFPAAAKVSPVRAVGGPATTGYYLSMFLHELPPAPASVRVALGAPGVAGDGQISREFFRCLARELGSLGIDDLVLSLPSGAPACTWLGDAVNFAKQACHIPHVSLRGDLFGLGEEVLGKALAGGLDCLIVEMDWGCPIWQQRVASEFALHPACFEHRLHRLLMRRDEGTAHAHKCLVKLLQIGDLPAIPDLPAVVEQLAAMSDLFAIERPALHAARENEVAASALCWGPFTEAHVDAKGHLLACSHDRTGTSFVADLKKVEFMQAWHGPVFQETRRVMLRDGQRACLCAQCPGKKV